MLDKITFQNGTIVTREYLNEVQKGTDFSGQDPRADYYAQPLDSEHASWGISQRDSIKDWELADPRQEPETSVGRLAHDGIVLKSYNPTTLEKVWGPPTLVETSEGSGTYGVWVEGGKIIGQNGEPIEWEIQFVQLLSTLQDNYIYIDEQEALDEIAQGNKVSISVGFALPSVAVPHIPLAKLSLSADGTSLAVDEVGKVVGAGYVDLRPSVYVGNLNTYPKTLRNTAIISDSYVARIWERVIVDTSGGSVVIELPATPADSDRVAIVDISGTFDRFPIVIRPGANTKINASVDDWIINIKDAHLELFYHAATCEWKFEEAPGGECTPLLGTFLSCGGREFIGERVAEECPDGQPLPATYPSTSSGVYRFEASTSKCYREFNPTTAIYSDGEGGLIKIGNAPRCSKDLADVSISAAVRNIIYVDPAIGDDSLPNNGFDSDRPFRTIERAIVEAVRESRREGVYNDRYDKVVVQLAPGDYYVDNSPGLSATPGLTANDGLIQRVRTGFNVLEKFEQDRAVQISIDSLNVLSKQPPVAFNLGRIIYSQSGGVGNIVKIQKRSADSSIWDITLEYVRGAWGVNDEIFYDNLSIINPSQGGIVVPRGISIDGVDLRKVRIRPMYVPELNQVVNDPQTERTYIFKVTGGSYISLMTFTDNPQFPRTHNTVTAVGFASEAEIRGSGNEVSYYAKLNSLFSEFDGWGSFGLENIQAETTIVAPVAGSKNLRQIDAEENLTGLPQSDARANAPTVYPGATQITLSGSGDPVPFALPDINSTRSSSPYVFNCSVRSIFGMNGLWADGSRVSGFKSMVTANFTQVSLQTDPNCFNPTGYYLDPPTNKRDGVGKQYKFSPADPFKYRHFGFRASNDSIIQIVSCFVIGNADHFISESGGDLSITNSCSDFGDISLRSLGYKARSFSQDEGLPSPGYGGTRITQIIPPLPLTYDRISTERGPTLSDTQISTGCLINYPLTRDYVLKNASNQQPPATQRVYIFNSNVAAPFSLENPPTAKDMAFGQFSYTKKLENGAYVLAGGNGRPNRQRIFITGINENGDSLLYCGNIIISDPNKAGWDRLDDRSKIFVWDAAPQIRELDDNGVWTGNYITLDQGAWYINVNTSGIAEEVTDLDGDGYLLKKFDFAYRYKLAPQGDPQAQLYASLDFIFDRTPVNIVRTIDDRSENERIYRVVLEGFNKDEAGIRKPQSYYVMEKQLSVPGYPLNGSAELQNDPLTLTQIFTYRQALFPDRTDESFTTEQRAEMASKFVTYLTQGNSARDVFTGDVFISVDDDEPEATEDPTDSVTRIALTAFQNRPGVYFSKGLGPSVEPINIKVAADETTNGILIGLRRPSVIRASAHTWEWTGYLNYDTSFPTFQGDPLDQDYALGKIIVEENGGRVYASGMNEEGNFYIGTTVFDLRTGEQFAIPLKAENEVGNVTNQVLNNVIIRSNLLMQDNSRTVFGRKTEILFSRDTVFKSLTNGEITPANDHLVYATNSRAGLVQFAKPEEVRGALGNTSRGVSSKVAVTAQDLANELELRFENAVRAGKGVYVGSTLVNPEGGDPNDPADDIIQYTINIGLPGNQDNVTFVGLRLGSESGQLATSISNSVNKALATGAPREPLKNNLVTEYSLRHYQVDTDQIVDESVTEPKMGFPVVPVGGIIMWSGLEAQLPTGWALCNGQTVNGVQTPNLVGRFIRGADDTTVGQSGAAALNATADTATLRINKSITTSSRAISGNITIPALSGETGGHGLTRAEIPNHCHATPVDDAIPASISYTPGSTTISNLAILNQGWTGGGGAGTSPDGCNTLSTGGVGDPHTHPISTTSTSTTANLGSHDHTVTLNENLDHGHTITLTSLTPDWYALAYIMRIL